MKEDEKPQNPEPVEAKAESTAKGAQNEAPSPAEQTLDDAVKPLGLRRMPLPLRGAVRLVQVAFAALFFAVVLILGAMHFGQSGVRLPAFAAQKIEDAIVKNLSVGAVTVADVRLKLDPSFQLIAGFEKVKLYDTDAEEIAQLDEISVIANGASLLRLAPEIVAVESRGLFAKLRRDRQGVWNWSFVSENQRAVAVPDFANIDQQFEAYLTQNPFTKLQNITVTDVFIEIDDQSSGRLFTTDAGMLKLKRKTNEDQTQDVAVDFDIALLSDQGGASYAQFRFASPFGTQRAQMSVALDDVALADIADFEPSLAWLAPFAAQATANLRVNTNDAGEFAPVNLQLEFKGGEAALGGFARTDIQSVKAYLKYSPDSGDVIIDDLSLRTGLLEMNLNAQLVVVSPQEGRAGEVYGHFATTAFKVSGDEIEALKGLSIPKVQGNFKSSLDGQKVLLDAMQMTLDENTKVFGTAQFFDGIASLDVNAQGITHAQLLKHWPETVKPKARKWVAERVLDTVIERAAFSLRNNTKSEKRALLLSADLGQPRLEFSKKFPVLMAQNARLTIEDNFLHVWSPEVYSDVNGKKIYAHDVSFQIDDITQKPNFGIAELDIAAPVMRVIDYLEQSPVRPLSRFKLSGQNLEGSVQGHLKVVTPLKPPPIKFPELEVTAIGRVTNFKTTTLVKNREIRGSDITLGLQKSGLRFRGPAAFDTIEGAANLWLPFDKSGPAELDFDASITKNDLASLGVRLGFLDIDGQTNVKGRLALTKERPWRLELTSDLRGLGVNVPLLPWRKPPRELGSLTAQVVLKKPLEVQNLKIAANGLETDLSVYLNANSKLDRTKITALKVAPWLDIAATITAKDGVSKVKISSGRIDMEKRPKPSKTSPSQNSFPFQLTGALNEFRMNERIVLRDLRFESLRADKSFGFQGRMGRAPVRGKIDGLGQRIVMLSPDAGAVVDAMNVTTQLKGGQLQMDLQQNVAKNGYAGRVLINDFRLIEMPVFAQLLSAISVVGLLEQLGKEGIQFDELDASFSFDPDEVRMQDSSAFGASIGLSARGIVNRSNQSYDFDGVVSPLYLVNVVGAPLTRKGEGLMGMTFGVKGQGKQSNVSVNPLSMLLPGPLRDLFRKRLPNK